MSQICTALLTNSSSILKYTLSMQFVAWNCKSCSITPLTDCSNNPIFQELPEEREYFTNADERIYNDLRDSKGYTGELQKLRQEEIDLVPHTGLKNLLVNNLRLRVWGYSQGVDRKVILQRCKEKLISREPILTWSLHKLLEEKLKMTRNNIVMVKLDVPKK